MEPWGTPFSVALPVTVFPYPRASALTDHDRVIITELR